MEKEPALAKEVQGISNQSTLGPLHDNEVNTTNGNNISEIDSPRVEESTEALVERLGRQRPKVFGSIWSEIGFVFSISMSQVLAVRASRPFYSNELTDIFS